MKKIIKNLTKLFVVAVFIALGGLSAEASFVSDPSTQGNGITSIAYGPFEANDNNSIDVDIPDTNDSEDFYVFIDYQNAANYTLNDVRGRIMFDETGEDSSTDFAGKLIANNGPSRSDEALLTGLPDNWEIEFVSAKAVNKHGSQCGPEYEYDRLISGVDSSAGGLIGDLDTVGQSSTNGFSGACSQGHIIAQFKVTNTGSSIGIGIYSWETSSWGPCVAGIQERDVFCENSNGNQVSSSLCSASTQPDSVQLCSAGGGSVNVDTLDEDNVTSNSAELRGDLISGGPAAQYWFVYSNSDQTPECTLFPNDPSVFANVSSSSSNPSFSVDQGGLQDNTEYWYRACVTIDGQVYGGSVEDFETSNNGGNNNGDDEPDASTDNARDIEDDSAELNGEIDMNDFDDGLVFFVWGQDEDEVEDVEDEDEYRDIDQQGDDLQKEIVDSSLDNRDDYDLDVDDLDEDERYYFRICVEYEDGNDDEIECGSVKDFDTDDDNGSSNNNDDVDIETTSYDDVGATFATLCGDLQDDGGDRSLRTRIEFRRTSGGSWVGSTWRQRGEGKYCVEVNGLQSETRYQYRACTDERDCGKIKSFTTRDVGGSGDPVNVNTIDPTNIGATSAILNGAYQGSENEPTRVWFEWGTSSALGTQKRVFTRSSVAGTFSDSFTGLRSCNRYYYRAVAQNSAGIEYGNTLSFRTACVINTGGPDVTTGGSGITVVDDVEEETIDLDLLGLGLSLIRLDIDNDQDVLARDQIVEYEISWENISNIDLQEIDLKITVPQEVSVTNITRGQFDADENLVFYTIDELDEGEDGSFIISGIVNQGTLGDLVTAEAAAAYDNPINDAQENATDYDTDEFVLNTNFGTASVFGLSNITFLGWITILLGLLIVFLIARWLYLEREELRAQAYSNGYQPMPLRADPRYDNRGPAALAQPQNQYGYQDAQPLPGAGQPNPVSEVPAQSDTYQPYRPDRS